MGVQWRPISGSIHDLHVSAPGPYVAAGGFFKNLVCGFQKSIFHRLVRCVQKARNQSLGLLLGQFDPHLPWFRRISILRGFKNFRIFGDHAIFEVSLKWGWPPPLYVGPTIRAWEIEPSHLGAPYSQEGCKSVGGRRFHGWYGPIIHGISQISIFILGLPILLGGAISFTNSLRKCPWFWILKNFQKMLTRHFQINLAVLIFESEIVLDLIYQVPGLDFHYLDRKNMLTHLETTNDFLSKEFVKKTTGPEAQKKTLFASRWVNIFFRSR